MRAWILAAAALIGVSAAAQAASAAVRGEEVSYTVGDQAFRGYLAYDDAMRQARPGVLVVHEWWGHNEYARRRAEMLAELGYIALAVDMYGDGKTAKHPEDAAAFSNAVTSRLDDARMRFDAAARLLKAHPMADPDRMAAIGYCFGGGIVLHMASTGADLDAVVSFHGSYALVEPAKPGEVTARVLVCHGGADAFMSSEQIETLKHRMRDARADFRFIVYDSAQHSFTNPGADAIAEQFGLGIGYDADADQASWNDMTTFLEESFQ
ncbi:MAG TPA: dienelactone hydrolase family protein [bacterium]